MIGTVLRYAAALELGELAGEDGIRRLFRGADLDGGRLALPLVVEPGARVEFVPVLGRWGPVAKRIRCRASDPEVPEA